MAADFQCKVMHLGKKNICYEYHLNDVMSTKQPLLETNLEKDVGVNVDKCLTFSNHLQYVANKANKILSMIKRSYIRKNRQYDHNVSLVRPLLEYGNTIWAPF